MNARRAAIALALVACGDPSGPPPVTRVELFAVPMIVAECHDDLPQWTVTVRETGEVHASRCDDPIVMSELTPYFVYTLEISADALDGSCWSGTCSVTPLPGLGLPDCPHATPSACADGGVP
jgi:hypothetical protein